MNYGEIVPDCVVRALFSLAFFPFADAPPQMRLLQDCTLVREAVRVYFHMRGSNTKGLARLIRFRRKAGRRGLKR